MVNITPTMMVDGVLMRGIPTLRPKDSRKIDRGQYYALNRALSGEAVNITCNYKHRKRQMPTVSAVLEVNSFAGVAGLETEGSRTIHELKRSADGLRPRGLISEPSMLLC